MGAPLRFERARVAVYRRRLRQTPEQAEPRAVYEVVAWPPGSTSILPQIGDQIHLPSLPEPVRVVDRSVTWPAPGSQAAERGELQVDLLVEPEPASFVPARAVETEPRWRDAALERFELRDRRRAPGKLLALHLDIDELGPGFWPVALSWQARACGLMPGPGPDRHLLSLPELQELYAQLRLGQRFQVQVGPNRMGYPQVQSIRPHPLAVPTEPELEGENPL